MNYNDAYAVVHKHPIKNKIWLLDPPHGFRAFASELDEVKGKKGWIDPWGRVITPKDMREARDPRSNNVNLWYGDTVVDGNKVELIIHND